jgi:hypothetical protein
MTIEEENTNGAINETIVQLEEGENREVLITLQDAQGMKAALENYLQSPELEKDSLPVDPPEYVGSAQILGPGDVRIGNWMLRSRSNNLVLIFRPRKSPGAQLGYQLVAYLKKLAAKWQVTTIHFVRLAFGR